MRPSVQLRVILVGSLITGGCVPKDFFGSGYSQATTYKACVVNYFQDGPANAARFGSISGLAIASNETVVVGDYYNARIRNISPDGQVTTLAVIPESGSGPLVDIDIDASGSIFFLNNAFVCKIESGEKTSTLAGSSNPFTGGFWQPWGLAVNKKCGNIVVADTKNNRIKRVSLNGVISEIAGSGNSDMAPINLGGGFADGTSTSAMFNRPASVACDPTGNIYVSDAMNHRVRKITPDLIVTTLAGSGIQGNQDGPGSVAQFGDLRDIAVSPDGTVYVVDISSNSVRKITPSGFVSTLPTFNPVGANPTGVAVDASGSVYIGIFTDQGDARGGQVLKLVPNGSYQLVAGELGICDWQTRVAM